MEKPEDLISAADRSLQNPSSEVSVAAAASASHHHGDDNDDEEESFVFEPMNPKLKDSLAFDNACFDVSHGLKCRQFIFDFQISEP